jgi:hypothetical protein
MTEAPDVRLMGGPQALRRISKKNKPADISAGLQWIKESCLRCRCSSRTELPSRRSGFDGFAELLAALQVADHAFEQEPGGLGIIRPIELLPAVAQVVEHVLQPQKMRFALCHLGVLRQSTDDGNEESRATTVPPAWKITRAKKTNLIRRFFRALISTRSDPVQFLQVFCKLVGRGCSGTTLLPAVSIRMSAAGTMIKLNSPWPRLLADPAKPLTSADST